MKSKFNITQSNIKNGKQADPANCAIAKAIKNEMKKQGIKVKNVSVLPFDVKLDMFSIKKNKFIHLNAVMPKNGCDFIKSFDHGKKVTPFALELTFIKG